jgi:hypothetical protein
VLAPMAHVLELPNKLALAGPLWLAVQRHLYRGWGPFWGAPVEIGALLTSFGLAVGRRGDRRAFLATLGATLAYALMILAFFVLNAPVNAAINRWTATTLPLDWPAYRLRWETGHAISAAASIVALAALIRVTLAERDGRTPPR